MKVTWVLLTRVSATKSIMSNFIASPSHYDLDLEPLTGNTSLPRLYSTKLKTDLHPGTFVLVSSEEGGNIDENVVSHNVGRILGISYSGAQQTAEDFHNLSSLSQRARVNIFRPLTTILSRQPEILHPSFDFTNNLRHLREIVQTSEVIIVDVEHIHNLVFVFKLSGMQENTSSEMRSSSLFFSTFQGMKAVYMLRFCLLERREGASPILMEIPFEKCLPFPSHYSNFMYDSCFPSRCWLFLMICEANNHQNAWTIFPATGFVL